MANNNKRNGMFQSMPIFGQGVFPSAADSAEKIERELQDIGFRRERERIRVRYAKGEISASECNRQMYDLEELIAQTMRRFYQEDELRLLTRKANTYVPREYMLWNDAPGAWNEWRPGQPLGPPTAQPPPEAPPRDPAKLHGVEVDQESNKEVRAPPPRKVEIDI